MADSAKSQALSQSLQHALRSRRPSRWLFTLLILVLMSGCAALWYWLAARTPTPDPIAVALDNVGVVGQDAELHAVFLAPRGTDDARYSGHALLVKRLDAAEGETHRADVDNHVKATLHKPERNVSFVIQYRSADARKFPSEDQATHFVWPADARILLVDVDSTLFAMDGESLRPGASEALLAVHKSGFHIVYMALDANEIVDGIPRRKQLRLLQHDQRLPPGPVLLRVQPNPNGEELRRSILTRFSKLFTRPPYVVIGGGDRAEKCRAVAGIAPLLLSDEEAPAGIPRCAAWTDVRRELASP